MELSIRNRFESVYAAEYIIVVEGVSKNESRYTSGI